MSCLWRFEAVSGRPYAVGGSYDAVEYGEWLRENQRLARDYLWGEEGAYVSTVFLGIDHSFDPSGPPVLWETMVFGGPEDQYQQRYTTREAALEGHHEVLERVRRVSGECE